MISCLSTGIIDVIISENTGINCSNTSKITCKTVSISGITATAISIKIGNNIPANEAICDIVSATNGKNCSAILPNCDNATVIIGNNCCPKSSNTGISVSPKDENIGSI